MKKFKNTTTSNQYFTSLTLHFITKSVFISLLLMLIVSPAFAHHSFGHFDLNVCKSIEGVVRKFEFSYPHTWLWVTVKENGEDVLWAIEGADPSNMAIHGWSQSSVKKGEVISMQFNPMRDGRNGGSGRQIILPSGEQLDFQGDDFIFEPCKEILKPPSSVLSGKVTLNELNSDSGGI